MNSFGTPVVSLFKIATVPCPLTDALFIRRKSKNENGTGREWAGLSYFPTFVLSGNNGNGDEVGGRRECEIKLRHIVMQRK